MVEKIVPDPFLKNENWAYLKIDSLTFYTVWFCFMPSWGLSKYTKTKLQSTSFHLVLSFFKKWRGLELVTLPHFRIIFEKKIFLLCSIIWPNFIVWLALLCEILGNMCIGIVCKSGCDLMKLILYFSSSCFSYMTKISWQKLKYLRTKKAFKTK